MKIYSLLGLASLAMALPRPDTTDLQVYPKTNDMIIKPCEDRNYGRCTPVRVSSKQCVVLPANVARKSRSVMLPKGAGCTLYNGSDCNDDFDPFRAYKGKSVADLRDCLFLGCSKVLELGVSGVKCTIHNLS
jgi:hypothetical protein